MTMVGCLPRELGPIRPPSEAYSLLIRVTRNCPWNRCTFCGTYRGTRFELRTVEEVKQDVISAKAECDRITGRASAEGISIREAAAAAYQEAVDDGARNVALWLYGGASSVFLQDANSLVMPSADLADILRFLKKTLPFASRVTSYARSKTAARKSVQELTMLREAGLTRLHLGLESGSDEVLRFVCKGVTAAEHIAGGRNIVAAGIELSEYVMPGLGGRRWSREHAIETARVINAIRPNFVRLRTLTVRDGMPLAEKVDSGEFVPLSEDEIVQEIRLLIENITASCEIKSDHMMNLLMEVDGKLPDDRGRLLGIIDAYLRLPGEERTNFKVGRRAGCYERLSDMENPVLRGRVDGVVERLRAHNGGDLEGAVSGMRAARAL